MEEQIHRPENEASAKTFQTCRRHLKIRQQPICFLAGGSGKPANDPRQLLRSETVEEKVCNYEIENLLCRIPFKDIHVNELHLRSSWPAFQQLPTRVCQHAFARVQTDHSSVRKTATALNQGTPVAFPSQQDMSRGVNLTQKNRAAALQLLTGQQEFHPTVVRSQDVKAHVQPAA